MIYTVSYMPSGVVAGICLDGATIPIDPLNADFQAFLRWNAGQATPIDYVSPQPVTLKQSQQSQLAAIDAGYLAYLAAGYTDATTGVTLAISPDSQNTFANDAAGMQAALTSGLITASTLIPFTTTTGARQLAASDYLALLGRAWQYCRAAAIQQMSLAAQVAAQTSIPATPIVWKNP